MTEPILTEEDHRAWRRLEKMALLHAKGSAYQRRLGVATDVLEAFATKHPDAILMWGGKDSTALVHLGRHLGLTVMSHKDDLDYPEERGYLTSTAKEWGIHVDIIEPTFSLRAWLLENGQSLIGEDVHGRLCEMADKGFYEMVEQAAAGRPIILGLRAKESRGRALNRATRGHVYLKKSGQWVCQPLADWTGLDVYAYLFTHNVEPMRVYRCIGFMHQREPWSLRTAWWIPGVHSARGQVAWLRRYYPSLYADLRRMMPGVEALG